ncbi:hypothetical protein CEXT_97481 [Caerostris extrusa]|uniref:DUF5641 domain-containing protein n=1 Tax=Caerostris extrusa TaxID=172846 RepID=A0AAV4XXX0_CAEEX|nr:hypothetical protein CEXT_97481 [Caerostris extrusa]
MWTYPAGSIRGTWNRPVSSPGFWQGLQDDEELGGIPVYYWSDSMNCLYWIKNDEQWATFVMNRVKKTRSGSEPLRRFTEIFPDKDDVTRLVKVKTASGEKLRPVQRLYSLEINAVSSEPLRHRALKGTRRLSQSMEKNLRNKIADPVKSKVDNQPVLNQKPRLGCEIKTVKRLDI